jgi:glycogen debranching enzyme
LFVAAWKYLQASGDEDFVRQTLLPALRKAVHAVNRGAFDGITVDASGLLSGGMEMNALWYNALAILAEIETRVGDPEEAKRLSQRAKRVQKRFQETSWEEEPGQVFALSLPFPLLPKANAVKVLAAIEEKLDPGMLGPYLTALVRVRGAAGRKKALSILETLKPRLAEADAQAWSVAEVLRAYVEDLQGGKQERVSKKRAPKEAE